MPKARGDMLNRTLEELDNQHWGEPEFQSNLVINCYRLRLVPLREFTDDDLRLLIRQKFSLDYLVPLAIVRLIDEPFAGDLYDGDLLHAVVSLPDDFWQGHPDLKQSLQVVSRKAQDQLRNQSYLQEMIDKAIMEQLGRIVGLEL